MPITDEEIKNIQEKLAQHDVQLNFAQQINAIEKEILDLKKSVDEKWRFFKIAAAVVSFLITVGGSIAGLVGFHTVQDAKKMMVEKMNADARQTNEFYGDVMASSVLYTQKRYDDAIPKLLKWFNDGHTYDKNILIPLLASLNIRDDWAEARPVIATLRSNPKKFDEINDAPIYTIIGSIEVQLGITDLNATVSDQGLREMERGYSLLERAYRMLASGDDDVRRNILTNEWLYYIATQDFARSSKSVTLLKSLSPKVKVYSWTTISRWLCVAAIARNDHAHTMRTAEEQWKTLSNRYFSE